MENFKFILFSIIILVLVGLIGYWAVFTIEPGDIYAYKQRQRELETRNKELEKELEKLKSELGVLRFEQEKQETALLETEEEPSQIAPTSSKYQSLIGELQKLVDDNVFMKVGSRGTRVGTVQTFLNLYNKTSKKVDNDYGAGTKTDVMNFQKAEGLTVDGETGPVTYRKMIEWLKKQ